MASLDDLFGPKQESRPRPPKWDNVGDFHDAFITAEPVNEQQKEVGGSWDPLYLEKQPGGAWKKKTEEDLTEGRENMKLMQIVIPARLVLSGEDTTLYFDNQVKKAALKAAMEASGLDIVVGTGLRITRIDNVGKQYGWKIQLAAPKGD